MGKFGTHWPTRQPCCLGSLLGPSQDPDRPDLCSAPTMPYSFFSCEQPHAVLATVLMFIFLVNQQFHHPATVLYFRVWAMGPGCFRFKSWPCDLGQVTYSFEPLLCLLSNEHNNVAHSELWITVAIHVESMRWYLACRKHLARLIS